MFEPPFDPDPLPDGVYIGLDAEKYFAQERLGSSDLIKLSKHKEGWWWQSRYNPDRKQEQTEAMNYGSALHAIVLEGVHAYESRFAIEPDPRDYPGLLTTTPQIKQALADAGIRIGGSSAFSKADWNDTAAVHLPGRPVWDNILDDYHTARAGKSVIGAIEDRMLRVMYDAAAEDPEIRELMGIDARYPVLAELSFFWTDDYGVKRRARFDKPVPWFTLDLKSLGNWEGRELKHAVGDRILKEGYDVQVGDQHDARIRMHAMINAQGERCISAGTPEQRTWLLAIAQKNLPWNWVWLFYQKPELTGRAPVVFPLVEHWRGPYHVSGYRKAVRAVEFYLNAIERFGLGAIPAASGRAARPWSRVERPHFVEPQESDQPGITIPHYGWDAEALPDEEEHFAR